MEKVGRFDFNRSSSTGRNSLCARYYLQPVLAPWRRSPQARPVANDELIKMSQNPKDWVMPAGDYANTRYSKLNQINAANVGKLQVAWTFSTGVLRGHEGGPLIIGNMMYVHTPFPNKVYALDLSQDEQDRLEVRAQAGSERHPGDVLRHG